MRDLSIRSKLALAFFIIAFFPLMALSFVLFSDVKSEMLTSTEENILSIVQSKKGEIDAFSYHNLNNVTFMSKMPNMGRIAEKLLNGEGVEKATDEMRGIFHIAKLSNKEIEALFFLHPESGEVLCSSTPGYEGMFFNNRPYFELGKKEPLIYRIHYSHAMEKNILAFAAPVVDDEKLLGVITVWISIDELKKIVKVSQSINTYLVSRSNLHLIGKDLGDEMPFRSGIFTVGATRALAGETGSGTYKDYAGKEVVGAYSLIESLDIALLAEIPMADILENANRKGVRYLIITSGLALIVLLIAFVIGNHITNPIMYLTRAIKLYGKGKLQKKIVTSQGGMEVSELASAFNNMIVQRETIEKELKEAKVKAEDEKAKSEAIIAGMGDGISIQNTNYEVLYQNKIHKGWVGDHVGKYCFNAYEKEEDVCDGCAVRMSFEDGEIHTTERTASTEDGLSYFEITASPLRDSSGKIIAGIEVVRNITERKKVEEQLSRRTAEFEAIFDSMPDVVVFADSDRHIILINAAVHKVFGYSPKELEGRSTEFLYASRDSFKKQGEKRFHVGAAISTEPYETKYRRKDGTVFVGETLGIVVKNNLGESIGFMGIIRDITERKHAEEQVERLNKNLIGKNKELEQVLYVTSHDLRSPLVNVEGFNRELEISIKELMTVFESWEVPPDILEKINPIIEKDIPESLKYIHSSTDKMDALLAGLLKISRIGRLELHKTQLDMNLLMGEIVEIFEFRLKEAGVKLKISELPSCIGDEHQLNQVFSNLIDNAIKYLDPNQPGIINISGYNEGERSVYCVEDNGIGIASDHQEKIFGLFYQLEPGEEKGEGLGLTAIRKILDMHDGKIWVESEYGKGSKFFVSLPA